MNENINQNNQKPLSLVIEDAERTIAETINATALSPILLEPIIKKYYDEIIVLKQQQIKQDRDAYEQAMAEKKDTKKTKGSK